MTNEHKLGHGYLKSYLHRIGKASNYRYTCVWKETAQYLIFRYNKYKDKRKALFRRIRDKLEISQEAINRPVLFYTKIGITELLVFLKETNICTRN